MRLTHLDLTALQRTIVELHAYRDLGEFRKAVPGLFLTIIPAEVFVLADVRVNIPARSVKVGEMWQSAPLVNQDIVARAERIGFEHPFTQYALSTGDMGAVKFSDFFTLPKFRDSELYQEFYRHTGIVRLLATASFSGANLATLNMTRGARDKDFTERDRMLLNLLKPHFVQARRNAERTSAALAVGAQRIETFGLTPREAEVALWLAQGKTNLEIALILQTRPRTVEKHVESILLKVGVENRTAAALMIAQAEWFQRERGV